MEPRFGHDFSQVRIHTGARAAESARSVDALAYTVGRDVVFGEGAYRPQMPSGRSLLAHELVHTIQQGPAWPFSSGNLTLGAAGTAAEIEAESCARSLSERSPSRLPGLSSKATAPQVQRVGFGEVELREAEDERIAQGCPVRSTGTFSDVSWGETSGLYPTKDNIYNPAKWDSVKQCELLRLRGAIHALGQRGEKVHRATMGADPFEQKLKPYHLVENFLSLESEIFDPQVKWFYLSNQESLPVHPTMSTLVSVKAYGPFHNVGGGDVPKGDTWVHFYKKGK